MHRRARSSAALALAAGALALLGGCGGGGQPGGTLRVLASGDFQTLDPGAAYYTLDYMVVYATQRPLYRFAPGEVAALTPDLAAAQPRVTDDGRTVTVRLREGLRYGPPVGRTITSADVKYAIQRAFSAGVPNGYVATYFGVLEGAPQPGRPTVPDITGIQTPDANTVVFRLAQPSGTFLRALTLPATAPVPREYAAPHDRRAPSDYGRFVVASGPYRIAAAADGRIRYRPGASLELVRNPNWDPRTDTRPARLNRVEFSLSNEDNAVASRRILAGRGMVNGDFVPDPASLRTVFQRRRSQIIFVDLGSQYAALNTQVKPLDDVNVRRAIVAATDRRALQLAAGGPLVGEVASHFLPPAVPGFVLAGGRRGPDLDFLSEPEGNLARARGYLRRAGYARGVYSGSAPLLMVGDDTASGRRVAEVLQAQLRRLGFRVTLRQVARDAMYARYCSVPKARVSICPNVGWAPDFPDGQAMLNLTFNGEAVVPENNANWPQLDVPAINAAMDRARAVTNPAARARAWADIDRRVSARAPAIPYLWNRVPNIQSADVRGVVDRWSGAWDLSYTSLR